MHYYINLALTLLWGAVFLWLPAPAAALPVQHRERERRFCFCALVTVQWTALSGLRYITLGVDTRWYVGHFYRMQNVRWAEIGKAFLHGLEKIDSTEPGYAAFAKGIGILTGWNHQALLLAVALLFFISLAVFVGRNSAMPCLSYVLFSCTLFEMFTITAVRQTAATAFAVLLSWECLKKRRFVPYAALVALGMTFHKSCLVLLPLYFIARIPLTKWYRAAVVCGVPLLYALRRPLLRVAATAVGYGDYVDAGAGGYGGTFVLLYTALTLVILWRSGDMVRRDPVNQYVVNALLMGLAVTPFVALDASVMRVLYYFALFLLLAVPQLLLTFPRRERAPLYAAVCAALVALWNPAYLWHVFFWQR